MKKEDVKLKVNESVQLKKKNKKKKIFKIVGVVASLYIALSIGLVDLKTKELEKSVNETTLISYKKLENITQDRDSYMNYYNNYNYNEEMFQKDLERYKNYENFLYEEYKVFSKENGAKKIITKDEFMVMINQLNYFNAKWSYFKNAYSDVPQFSGSYYSSIIFPIFLEVNDPNYNKVKLDVVSASAYRSNYDQENNVKWEVDKKSQIYYHKKIISIMVPFSLLPKEKAVAYNNESIYRTQKLGKDIYSRENNTLTNYNNLTGSFKELNEKKSNYNLKNKEEVAKFDAELNKVIEQVMKEEYERLNYDREYQYNTFKFLNANKALKESIDNLVSTDGEKNLQLLDSDILYPATLIYSFYKDLAKIEESRTYSSNYDDGELLYKILGIEDIFLNKEMMKEERHFLGEREELYPFLK